MDAFIPPGATELSAADTQRLPGLVAGVLASDPPVLELLNVLARMEQEQNPALAVAVFESVAWRVDVHHYWVWFRLSRCYSRLGPAREDAAFIASALAAQMHPDWPASTQPFRELFVILNRRQRTRDAVDLFLHETDLHPEKPAAELHEIAPLFEQLALPLPVTGPALALPGSRHDHRAADADIRPPWTCPVYGGATPYALRPLAEPLPRTAIEVAELPDAELLICNDGTAVHDRDGRLHEDLSVSSYPDLVRRRVERLEASGQASEHYAADDVVVIADRFAHQNLCHFLLDQASRLALYRRVGVDIGAALAIGPELRTEFQRSILAQAGVGQSLGVERVARVRARRLWVSTNCRELLHAGHCGADWAVAFAREILGGRGECGRRRLYVSRADADTRHVVNEAEILPLLARHGFEVIVPGRMPYPAQVAAFREASHVIAPHGAALTHMVLCPPGAHVLEIFNPLYGTAAYAMQAQACGVNYAALVARDGASDAPEWNDPELTDVTQSQHGPRNMRVLPDVLAAYLSDTLGPAGA